MEICGMNKAGKVLLGTAFITITRVTAYNLLFPKEKSKKESSSKDKEQILNSDKKSTPFKERQVKGEQNKKSKDNLINTKYLFRNYRTYLSKFTNQPTNSEVEDTRTIIIKTKDNIIDFAYTFSDTLWRYKFPIMTITAAGQTLYILDKKNEQKISSGILKFFMYQKFTKESLAGCALGILCSGVMGVGMAITNNLLYPEKKIEKPLFLKKEQILEIKKKTMKKRRSIFKIKNKAIEMGSALWDYKFPIATIVVTGQAIYILDQNNGQQFSSKLGNIYKIGKENKVLTIGSIFGLSGICLWVKKEVEEIIRIKKRTKKTKKRIKEIEKRTKEKDKTLKRLDKVYNEHKRRSEERKKKDREFLEKEPFLKSILGYFWNREQKKSGEELGTTTRV